MKLHGYLVDFSRSDGSEIPIIDIDHKVVVWYEDVESFAIYYKKLQRQATNEEQGGALLTSLQRKRDFYIRNPETNACAHVKPITRKDGEVEWVVDEAASKGKWLKNRWNMSILLT